MTSRLRDVLTITIGAYLVALGVLFIVDSSGWYEVGVGGLVEGAVGLFLIALGVLSGLAAMRARRFARRLSRAFGHVRSAGEWRLDDAVIRTVIGDIHLDLRSAELPEGETELTLLCWLGTVQVRVPAGVGVDVDAQTIVGSVDALGVREEGLIRDINVRTDDYATATHRLRLRVSTVVGEILVVRSSR
jgi:hypothetical protein